jgi:hypothetical protein
MGRTCSRLPFVCVVICVAVVALPSWDGASAAQTPPLTMSGYLPSGDAQYRITAAVSDGAGNIYIIGSTFSTDLATPGAYDTTQNGNLDVFVSKIGAAGVVTFTTYLGGTAADEGTGIALDTAGNIYVTGQTASLDFPTTAGAYDRSCGQLGQLTCFSQVFVTKLNPAGSALVYSTFVSDTNFDKAHDIGVDAAGRAYVVGTTRPRESRSFPVTPDAFDSIGSEGGFHFVLNASGARNLYSTFLSGALSEDQLRIAVQPDGTRVVVGLTSSSDFPMLAPLQPVHGGSYDLFVVKFAPSNVVFYSTYVGGPGQERPLDVTIDGDGDIYVAGQGNAPLPAQTFAFGAWGGADGFVMKIAGDGSEVIYSGVFGGSRSQQSVTGIAVDQFGRAHVAGSTLAPDFGTTPDAVRRAPVRGSASDAFYGIVDASGNRVTYMTRMGGSSGQQAEALVFDGNGNAVVVGETSSSDFPIVNHPSTTPTGAFLFKFAIVPPAAPGGGNPREIVLYAANGDRGGGWQVVADATAAGGSAVRHPNAGLRVPTPLAEPRHFIELTFTALAGIDYRLWLRGKADANNWANDSLHVQFSDSITAGGAPTWRIGSTSGTTVQIERCLSCGLRSWGWNDNDGSLTTADRLGPLVRFRTTGSHTIRLQTREDGLTLDQIVLSAERFLTSAPGPARSDTTILDESTGSEPEPPACGPGEIVLHTADAELHGAWTATPDPMAASGVRVHHPNAGEPIPPRPLSLPVNYFEMPFFAEAGTPYRLWLRLKADGNHWSNDSAWVQFSDSVSATGTPAFRSGTTSAAIVQLENCLQCRLAGWGWNDHDYGGAVPAPPVYFAATGMHTIRVQTREDGLSIDQIVLSAARYFDFAPGNVRFDTTILPACPAPVLSTQE